MNDCVPSDTWENITNLLTIHYPHTKSLHQQISSPVLVSFDQVRILSLYYQVPYLSLKDAISNAFKVSSLPIINAHN